MRRERKKDFDRMRNTMHGLIGELVREQLSHKEWLERLDRRIYQTEEYARLTAPHVSELYGMARGAQHALPLVWCHWYKNKFQTSEECQADPEFSYQQIDSDKSRYCWADTRKVF